MKWASIAVVLSLMGFALNVSAQLPSLPGASSNFDGGRISAAAKQISISGKVISESGSAPSETGDVVLRCGSEERARVPIDRNGYFSMNVASTARNDADQKLRGIEPADNGIGSWSDCDVIAEVRGYSSESVHLTGNVEHMVQVGSIIIHPLAGQQGFTVSVGSLQAPDKAKKAFEKGQEQEKKGRWAAACDYFKRAIQAYPRYAMAWLELGRAQAQQNSFVEAQQSFHEAASKDSHLTEAYVELARVALAQKEWKELADATEHLTDAYPDSEPQFWFFNGVANFNLGNKSQAEHSAERGLRLDTKHSIPQLEYLYGMTLAVRGDYKSASEHIDAYLHLSPNAPDKNTAQAKLAEIQKLANPEATHEVDFSLH